MALINGIYIHVTSEELSRKTELSDHSVELGIDITDHAKPAAAELSISGKIVSYTEAAEQSQGSAGLDIKAWLSLVKKDGSAFDTMSFDYLDNELLHFEGGVTYADTGAIQYFDNAGAPVDVSNGSTNVYQVKFEVNMPYEGKVRLQNNKVPYCAFNIINKSSTGYGIQDYNADAEISDIIFSNTYNGERGRVRPEFTNYDTQEAPAAPGVYRSAGWVLQQLNAIARAGALVTYDGRNALSNYQIASFSTTHPNTIAGGAEFSMSLKECRTAKNSYGVNTEAETTSGVAANGTQQVSTGDTSEVWYTVKANDTVWGLVSGEYANLKREAINGVTYTAINWVMAKNPSAFSKPGDFTTLKAGAKILLGTR